MLKSISTRGISIIVATTPKEEDFYFLLYRQFLLHWQAVLQKILFPIKLPHTTPATIVETKAIGIPMAIITPKFTPRAFATNTEPLMVEQRHNQRQDQQVKEWRNKE